MLRYVTLAALAAAAMAACPNQCSGHGRCGDFDKCVCFRQQGLYSPYRYGYTGADCSQRTCPLGRAYDRISSSTPELSPLVFTPSKANPAGTDYESNNKLVVVFNPAAQDDNFRKLRRDQSFVVQIMSTTGTADPYGTFAWRFEEDEYFQPEQSLADFVSATRGFALSKFNGASTGVFMYWDAGKGATEDFRTTLGEIAAGDSYTFTLTWNEGDNFDATDSNTAHQLIECSGRGSCDSETGKCSCLPGYTGEACQRTVCPNSCSGHGACQTELRFAVDGLSSNAGPNGYIAYDREQQYGCKCDAGYRGPDCSQVECPSGPDVLGADGGAEGMDCSGRGLCDYSTGVCKCFRGFFGERCEQQTTLI